jgi:hypothetical protein
MDDSAYSDHMRPGDKQSVVARGAGVAASHLFSDATWPKEILEPASRDVGRSKAKLKFNRKRGEKKVLVKVDVWAKKFQTLQFNLLEEKAASSDETIEMDGKVRAGFEGPWGDDEQSLQPQPWGVAYDSRFVPT